MSKFVLLSLVLFANVCLADMRVQTLIANADEAETGAAVTTYASKKTFQAKGIADDAGEVTVVIEASNVSSEVDADWISLGTIVMDLGATSESAGFSIDSPWKFVRARISALTCDSPCDNPVVSVYMGSEQ